MLRRVGTTPTEPEPEPEPSQVRLYTVAEVAGLFRVSRMTIYRLVHAGDLPAIRVGRLLRIPASALTAVLTPAGERPEQFGLS